MVGIEVLEGAAILHKGEHSLLYLVTIPEYGGRVLLKLQKEQLNKEATLQLENEYSVLRQFSSSKIRHVLGKLEVSHQRALVMKYIEGLDLKVYLNQYQPDITEKLIIAVSLCQLLGEVHSEGLLHGNFCSENIIVHPETLSTTLIDFKLASPVPVQVQETDLPEGLALAYLAPELSGKASGTADERADLYSLGVTLYELFAEVLPFTEEDPQALIHAHLAVDPLHLLRLKPELPKVLAEIVHKLMAKSPEIRYQTAAGVQADLEQCIALYEQKGEIPLFPLARFDSTAALRFPTTLIGREQETMQVRKIWQSVAGGAAEVVWISGMAGIGKTTLANQVENWARKSRGQMARGKYDLLSASKPYNGLVQAINGLIELWLTKDEDEVTNWRDCIQEAVEREGRLLTDLIPRLKLLLGSQPPVAQLDGPEAQHRFHYVFRNFLKALATENHPLVLQLDDLQWADTATLAFLHELFQDLEFSHFMFIGIYRAEEAKENPHLLGLIENNTVALPVHRLALTNLKLEEVNSFLAETFQTDSAAVHQLANVLYAKTKGNPLFLTQFLRSAYEQALLWKESSKGNGANARWMWEIEKIAQLPQTENVLSLIISRFNQLDSEMQFLLQAAACVGNLFDRNVLLELTGKSIRHPLSVLSSALQEGYLVKVVRGEESVRIPVYRFLHDRLMQAVLSTVEAQKRQEIHLQTGKILKAKLQQQGQEAIFDTVTHLRLAKALLSEAEQVELSHLSLQAAEKAMESAGYVLALDYLETSISLLNPQSWQADYEFTLNLYSQAAQAAYLQGDYHKMEGFITEVLQNAGQEVDKSRVLETKIQALIASNQGTVAVDTALMALARLGINLPRNPSKAAILASLLKTEIMLRSKGLNKLASLPVMTDPKSLAAMHIMGSVGAAVSRSAPQLFPVLVCTLVQLSLKKGNALASIPAYSGYGVLQTALFNKVKTGNAYGKLAVDLLKAFKADAAAARTYIVIAAFLDFWINPLRNSIQIAKKTYAVGLKTGDLEFAASGLMVEVVHGYLAGEPLAQLAEKLEENSQQILKLKQELLYQQTCLFHQVVLNLMQEDGLAIKLQGKVFDEEVTLTEEFRESSKAGVFYFYLHKMMLAYLAGNYSQALNYSEALEHNEEHVMATSVLPVYVLYDGLIRAGLYTNLPPDLQKKALIRLKKAKARMKQWAKHAPMNFRHKYQLLKGEWHRLKGDMQKARVAYEQAAEGAHQQGFLQEKALAYELAGRHLIAQGKQEQANICLNIACNTYGQWGAHAKTTQLLKAYPDLGQTHGGAANGAGVPVSKKTLNVESLLKAAAALSSQMKLDKMLENVLTTVLQLAGAQEAYVILNKEDELEVAARGAAGTGGIELLDGVPVEEYQELPSSIVNLTYRTGEELVVSDAQTDSRFASDATVAFRHIRSVLSFPVIRQQRVLGIIYLHNTLSTGAFNETQLQVLRLLSGQIAVALENALLYTQMEQRVEERTRELMVQQQILKYKNDELQQLNDEKDELVNIVAHDLRSPLNQIKGMLNLIKLSPDNLTPDQKQFVDLSLKSSERLSGMIGRILDTNAMDSHDIALNLEVVDLDILLEEVVTNFKIQAAEKDITLQLILPEEPIELELDRNYTIQVLENLLSNAIKFSPPDTQVQVVLYTDDDIARIEVTDEGPGISPKDQRRLFSKFQTLSARPTAGEDSTGLGLSIAKRYVEAMGGNIGCSSEMGEGTTFYVEFVLV